MSSDEYEGAGVRFKRRRLQNACDICRRRKVKCDSSSMPNNICTNCIAFRSACTHQQPIRKRGPKSEYVELLEEKLRRMEEILDKLYPDAKNSLTLLIPRLTPTPPSSTPSADSDDSLDTDDFQHIALSEHFKQLDISPIRDRFFGPSSTFMLVKNVTKAKDDYVGDKVSSVVPLGVNWGLKPWEALSAARSAPHYQFPPPDLMASLITLYFTHVNFLLGALHEPMFRRSVAEGLHFRDHSFGAVVLAVCALGARFSNDLRVFADGQSELSAGWIWFDQIQSVRWAMPSAPTLYDLQLYVILCTYVQGISTPQDAWTILSLGIRYCQELGIHRRKPRGYKMTLEDEMKKRCFWLLVSLDRFAFFYGRPPGMREEDYDVELPIDCDDECMDSANPDLMFKQPPGKPSLISFAITFHKLQELLGFALRTIYSIKKSKHLFGLVGPDWEQRTVSGLDSALNSWEDSVPDHLRWDPHREDEKFFHQSTVLYCCYYTVRVQIHRPFIQRSSSQGEASLAMCANAARSCSRVLEAAMTRGLMPSPLDLTSVFICGAILVINVFRTRRAGGHNSASVSGDLAAIDVCLRYLEISGRRWSCGERLGQLLQELSSAQSISFPLDPPPPVDSSRKRSHVEMNPAAGPSTTYAPSAPISDVVEGEVDIPFLESFPPFPNELSLEELLGMDVHNNRSYDPLTMSQDVGMGWSEASPVFDESGWMSYVANMLGSEASLNGST